MFRSVSVSVFSFNMLFFSLVYLLNRLVIFNIVSVVFFSCSLYIVNSDVSFFPFMYMILCDVTVEILLMNYFIIAMLGSFSQNKNHRSILITLIQQENTNNKAQELRSPKQTIHLVDCGQDISKVVDQVVLVVQLDIGATVHGQ